MCLLRAQAPHLRGLDICHPLPGSQVLERNEHLQQVLEVSGHLTEVSARALEVLEAQGEPGVSTHELSVSRQLLHASIVNLSGAAVQRRNNDATAT